MRGWKAGSESDDSEDIEFKNRRKCGKILMVAGCLVFSGIIIFCAKNYTDLDWQNYSRKRTKSGLNDTIYEWHPTVFENLLVLDSAFCSNLAYDIFDENHKFFEEKRISTTKSYLKNIKRFGESFESLSKSHGFVGILENDNYDPGHFNLKTLKGMPKKYSFIVVAFRGTDNIFDVNSDLNFKITDNYGLHEGFFNRFRHEDGTDEWISHVLEIIGNEDGNKRKILFTGHSLGAAESTIAPVYLKKHIPKLINKMPWYEQQDIHYYLKRHLEHIKSSNFYVVNFGSPRLGNKKFKKLFHKTVTDGKNGHAIRVLSIGDPIVRQPFKIINKIVQDESFLHTIDNSIMIYPETKDSSKDMFMVDCNLANHRAFLANLEHNEKDFLCGLTLDQYEKTVKQSFWSRFFHTEINPKAHSMVNYQTYLAMILANGVCQATYGPHRIEEMSEEMDKVGPGNVIAARMGSGGSAGWK